MSSTRGEKVVYLSKCKWAIRALSYKLVFGKIGNFSYIGKPVSLEGIRRIKIGNKVRIYPGARLETYNNGMIDIRDNVSIGQNFHITSSGKSLVVCENTTISANVFITNIDHEYKKIDVHILNQEFIEKETRIGPNCFIGFGAAIQAGTILGKQCIVGTNAVVRGEFPDYSVIVGAPARLVKIYDEQLNEWTKI